MPPISKTTKEDIINKAIEITKNEGVEALNARRLAKELNVSTQPIFSQFNNMDEIKDEMLIKMATIFREYLTNSNYDKPLYKDIGLNYIKFAREEPIIFNLLFNSISKSNIIEQITDTELVFKTISKQTGLSISDSEKFHMKMWLYVNGIANLVANKTWSFTDDEIEELLSEQYLASLLYEVKIGKVKPEVVEMTIKNRPKKGE